VFNFKMEKEDQSKQKQKIKEITNKKELSKYEPSWEEIWSTGYPTTTGKIKKGILDTKLTQKDEERLLQVKIAIEEGKIGTEVQSLRKFTKTHAMRLYSLLSESLREEKLEELVKNKPANYILIDTREKLEFFKTELQRDELFGFDIETFSEEDKEFALDPWRGNIAGFSVSNSKYHFYLPLLHTEQTKLNQEHSDQYVQAYFLMNELKPYLEQIRTVMHNASFDCRFMYVQYDIDMVKNLHADTRIIAFMLDENRHNSTHKLKDLVSDWLKIPSDNFDDLFKESFNKVPLKYSVYPMKDTDVTLSLYNWMYKQLEKPGLSDIKKLIFEVEMPVCRIFIKSDIKGIGFDRNSAQQLDKQFAEELIEIEKEIYKLFGKEINLNSPLQLKQVLFDELKLSDPDKGSTGVNTLKKIKNEHPSIPLILEYRQLSKLRSSFTQSLPGKIQEDGKIHPNFNTLGAKTGRFTCSFP
jgi:DNA polymerase I